MKLNLATFAVLKDLFGEIISVEVGSQATIADLFLSLNEQYPEHAKIWKRCRIACNNTFVANDYQIQPSDSLSIMPPSSGG